MKALILGIGGQDGSYLAENLLSCGWEVHGLYRRTSVDNLGRIAHIRNKIILHKGDLLDLSSVTDVILRHQPNVIFNEADQDDASWSFHNAGISVDVTYGFVAKILAWMHLMGYGDIRFFQPLSATVFGDADPMQNEDTAFSPQSPYACAKAACYDICNYYRNVHGMFVSTGIFYNHDSPRRGAGYLLQHLARTAVINSRRCHGKILVGNPDAVVDIGYAADYMWAAAKIALLDEPDDFVVATGIPFTIRELAMAAMEETDWCNAEWIAVDPDYVRPDANVQLIGDPSKVYESTGWRALTNAEQLVRMITRHHLENLPCE